MNFAKEMKYTQNSILFLKKNLISDHTTVDENEPLLPLRTAIFHDTLLVLAEAVRQMDYNSIMGTMDISCLEEKSWESGATFFNYINSVDVSGITGKIRFQV